MWSHFSLVRDIEDIVSSSIVALSRDLYSTSYLPGYSDAFPGTQSPPLEHVEYPSSIDQRALLQLLDYMVSYTVSSLQIILRHHVKIGTRLTAKQSSIDSGLSNPTRSYNTDMTSQWAMIIHT